MSAYLVVWQCGCSELADDPELPTTCPGHGAQAIWGNGQRSHYSPIEPLDGTVRGHECSDNLRDQPCAGAAQPDLFEGVLPMPEPVPDPYAGLGQDARRTAQQRDMIAAGQHPATKLRLADNGHTCGDCAHLIVKRRSGTWFKCALQLHDGQGLDIRKKWPACTAWADPSLTKDNHAK